jgi:hypothetical protein
MVSLLTVQKRSSRTVCGRQAQICGAASKVRFSAVLSVECGKKAGVESGFFVVLEANEIRRFVAGTRDASQPLEGERQPDAANPRGSTLYPLPFASISGSLPPASALGVSAAGSSRAGAIGMRSAATFGAVFAALCLRAIAVGVVTQPHTAGIPAKTARNNVHPPAATHGSGQLQLLGFLKGDFVVFVGKSRYPHGLQWSRWRRPRMSRLCIYGMYAESIRRGSGGTRPRTAADARDGVT